MSPSLINTLKDTYVSGVHVCYRGTQTFGVGAGQNLFGVTGGAIEILQIIGRCTVVPGGATTLRILVNGVNADSGAIALAGMLVGDIVWSPLNVAGAGLMAAAVPCTVATLTTMVCGLATGTNLASFVTATVAVNTVGLEFAMAYRRLNPHGEVYAA